MKERRGPNTNEYLLCLLYVSVEHKRQEALTTDK